jgi:hypothetical protein
MNNYLCVKGFINLVQNCDTCFWSVYFGWSFAQCTAAKIWPKTFRTKFRIRKMVTWTSVSVLNLTARARLLFLAASMMACLSWKWQGCQMVYFKTKLPVLAHFGSPLKGKIFYDNLVCFVAVCFISWQFDIPMFWQFVKKFQFWYIVSRKIWQPCTAGHIIVLRTKYYCI